MLIIPALIFLITIPATILSFCCIFAGTIPNVLSNVAILTVNASSPASNGPVSPPVYSTHILRNCGGFQEQNGTYTRLCTDMRATSFDLWEPIGTSSESNAHLGGLPFPPAIEDGLQALRLKGQVMFGLYMCGAGITALAVLMTFFGLCIRRATTAMIGFVLALSSTLVSAGASGLAHHLALQATRTINQGGSTPASRGDLFLRMTWAATALMFLVAVMWLGEYSGQKGQKEQKGQRLKVPAKVRVPKVPKRGKGRR